MDDFVAANLHESRNEWTAQLVSKLTPLYLEGIYSIFDTAYKTSLETRELNKWGMVFQTMLKAVATWTPTMIQSQCDSFIERSGCNFFDDLITCVHIIQLKILTCIRVGNKTKKINISIPKFSVFLHDAYLRIARKVHGNVYLVDPTAEPYIKQQHRRELEHIIQECIMSTIRDNMPINEIIRAYLDESVEDEETITFEDVIDDNQIINDKKETEKETEKEKETDKEKEKEKEKQEEIIPYTTPSIQNVDDKPVVSRLTFNPSESAEQPVVLQPIELPSDPLPLPKTTTTVDELFNLDNPSPKTSMMLDMEVL